MLAARGHLISWVLILGTAALALSGLGVVAGLVQFWGTNPEYLDRFVILTAAGWLAWNKRRQFAAVPGSYAGFVFLIVGVLAAPPAWYLAGQLGQQRRILLWWLGGAWVLSAGGAILIAGGWRWLRPLAFPLVFVLFALPIPERIELPLQNELQTLTTYVAAWGLRASGMTVHRDGFELHLPSGGLEVVEACSGVRSITALLAIAAFVAHWRGFGLVRGLVLSALSLPVIAAVNALRIILTGWIQESFGPQFVQGTPHEMLGIVMVLVGLCLVLGLSQLLRPQNVAPAQALDGPGSAGAGYLSKEGQGAKPIAPPAPPSKGEKKGAFRLVPAATLLALGLGASIFAYWSGYARVSRELQSAPFDQLPKQIGEWTAEDLSIPGQVEEMLTYDRACFRRYRNQYGNAIYVWAIYWQASTAIRGYHHPDICFPNRGWTATRKGREPLEFDQGQAASLTVRHFERGRDRQRVYYWTQEGRRVWTEEDENNADMSGPGHNWIRDRLVENPPEMSARVTVIMQAAFEAGLDERMLKDFIRDFARELYHLCPWARPEGFCGHGEELNLKSAGS
jgi:EpsI family protein